jgi:ribosomal protein S18 acetylase RimI-like enzyme
MFRDATQADRSTFLELWVEMYDELQQYDCPYESDPDTMRDVAALFDAYVDGALFGCVVLFDPPGEGPQGVTMIGEAAGRDAIRSPKRGRTAQIWGIHMRPEHRTKRIGHHLMQNAFKKLREMHFKTVLSEVALGNEPAMQGVVEIGCSQSAIVHTLNLEVSP